MKEAGSASTLAIFLIIKVEKHLSQIGSNTLQAHLLIRRWLWSKVSGKFTATQIRHIMALASFDAPLELIAIFGFVLLDSRAHHDAGSDAIRNVTQAQCVTLRPILIGVIAILAFKV